MKKVLYIFGSLNDLDIDWLCSAGQLEKMPVGAALITEGQPIGALYILMEGAMRVTMVAAGDREVAQLAPGEIIGEMSFVDARPPSATVKAMAPSVVLAIPRAKLQDKMQEDTGFAARFYRALAVFLTHRLRRTDIQLSFGKTNPVAGDDDHEMQVDEIDSGVLDNLHLAGGRFDRMLKRTLGR